MGLSVEEGAAVDQLVSQLQAHFERKLRHTYLYGSKARGDDVPGSDVGVWVTANRLS